MIAARSRRDWLQIPDTLRKTEHLGLPAPARSLPLVVLPLGGRGFWKVASGLGQIAYTLPAPRPAFPTLSQGTFIERVHVMLGRQTAGGGQC